MVCCNSHQTCDYQETGFSNRARNSKISDEIFSTSWTDAQSVWQSERYKGRSIPQELSLEKSARNGQSSTGDLLWAVQYCCREGGSDGESTCNVIRGMTRKTPSDSSKNADAFFSCLIFDKIRHLATHLPVRGFAYGP